MQHQAFLPGKRIASGPQYSLTGILAVPWIDINVLRTEAERAMVSATSI
jgi:hypothetical protein